VRRTRSAIVHILLFLFTVCISMFILLSAYFFWMFVGTDIGLLVFVLYVIFTSIGLEEVLFGKGY